MPPLADRGAHPIASFEDDRGSASADEVGGRRESDRAGADDSDRERFEGHGRLASLGLGRWWIRNVTRIDPVEQGRQTLPHGRRHVNRMASRQPVRTDEADRLHSPSPPAAPPVMVAAAPSSPSHARPTARSRDGPANALEKVMGLLRLLGR